MMTSTMTSVAEMADDELVAQTLVGNRDAFGRIVARYQSLICSLAYSATGSLGQSEDLAQETFITAWKHLGHLRERTKLRAWLCGIARNRINSSLRRDRREPLLGAEPLEAAHDSPAPEPQPHDQTITNEEAAILWRSLERIPEIYREPLVLFYREHQSVEKVAEQLELTEDNVKQRLSRGRKLLQEQILSFVEGALERSNPGRAFTLAVLATLPVLATSAKAATLGAAAAKGSMLAKAATGAGLFGAILGPLLGLVGPWIQYRMFLENAKTEEERTGIKRSYRWLLFGTVIFGVALASLIYFGAKFINTHPVWFAEALFGLTAVYIFVCLRMAVWADRKFHQFRAERDVLEGNLPTHSAWEYRSRVELLGLPLIHIRLKNSTGQRSPVKAWIAAGDCAIGVVFAFGGLAIAPVSLGGAAIGLISWGALAVGGFAAGGFALGGWAFGGMTMGWQSFGGCALAWNAAMGGLAIAREFALGGVAQATQANNEAASQFMKSHYFFKNMELLSHHIGFLNLFWLVPLIGWWRALVRRSKKQPVLEAPERKTGAPQ